MNEKNLSEETRALVEKWEKSGLLDKNAIDKNQKMAILLASYSTLIMEDGTRIDYMNEEEKQKKLKEYNYGKFTKNAAQSPT
jgi:hypothetical protein